MMYMYQSSLFLFLSILSSSYSSRVSPAVAAFSPISTTTTTTSSRTTLTKMASSSPSDGSSTKKNPPQHVIIAGGGVIGTTTAYYLAHNHGIASTVIDPTGTIAPAASGKAGGFLALDWNDMSPLRQLARRSFALHQTLADALGATRVDYRRLMCASIGVDPTGRMKPRGKKFDNIEWATKETTATTTTKQEDAIAGNVVSFQVMGDTETIAQVHPKKLCVALWESACSKIEETSNDSNNKKNQLVQGKVTSIAKHENDGSLVGVTLEDGTLIPGDTVLLACGPWTANIMTGIKYHSVIIPTDNVLHQCVFFAGCGDPEVYVRPDATAYCTGFPDPPQRVTEQPGQEEVRPEAADRIVTAVRTASSSSSFANNNEPEKVAACYLPSTPDGLPIMGQVQDDAAVYVASGHTCWGILLGPASGETMAHLIATGQTATDHVSLAPFQPARFRNLQLLEEQ
ncbi:oxidoreductase [Seminavis robusta]|uniref:Oxidoreductase n=1 Tax=Seminavis robusta TaxID=568900 RepID=A0A9N8E1P3_9STRA|nr:oxidoreductase [Seminavis robusta]|eukprot:Sro562_g167020.1 oxidoreductase (457) ;mRNA; r:27362-28732